MPVLIAIGSDSGSAGQQVQIGASFSQGLGRVAALQANISFDSTKVSVALDASSQLDCTIDPLIGPGSIPDKQLAAGGANSLLIVLVFGFNQNIIPDGPIFTCRFNIAAGAPAGDVSLHVEPVASDPFGVALPVGGVDGSITVE